MRRPAIPAERHDGTRRWQTRHVAEHAAWLEQMTLTINAELPGVLDALWSHTLSGVGSQGEVTVAGGRYAEDGSNNGIVPNLAIDWDDPDAADMKTVILGVVRAGDVMEQVARAMGRLSQLDPERAKWLSERTDVHSGAACTNCGRWVEGTPQDRIRSGRCQACYRFRVRNGRERPKVELEEVA